MVEIISNFNISKLGLAWEENIFFPSVALPMSFTELLIYFSRIVFMGRGRESTNWRCSKDCRLGGTHNYCCNVGFRLWSWWQLKLITQGHDDHKVSIVMGPKITPKELETYNWAVDTQLSCRHTTGSWRHTTESWEEGRGIQEWLTSCTLETEPKSHRAHFFLIFLPIKWTVSGCWGCCSRTPQTDGLKNNRHLVLVVVEAGYPRSRHLQIQCVV